MSKTVVIDASKWQVFVPGDGPSSGIKFDLAKFAAHDPPAGLMVYRASIGDYYSDPYAVWMIENMRKLKIPVSVYFVPDPNIYRDNATTSALNQVNRLKATMASFKEFRPDGSHTYNLDFPIVIDIEKLTSYADYGLSFYNQLVYDSIRFIEDEFLCTPVIYSSTYFWKRLLGESKEWHSKYKFWMALYGAQGKESVTKPEDFKLPANLTRDNLILHQVTDKDDGLSWGYASKGGDKSYWVHPTKSLEEYITEFRGSIPEIPPLPPSGPCGCCSVLKMIQEIACKNTDCH